jgi:hypothetical protein
MKTVQSFIYEGQDAEYVVYWDMLDGQLDLEATLGINTVTDDLYDDVLADMYDIAWDEYISRKDYDHGC